jgi:hypothetical protein
MFRGVGVPLAGNFRHWGGFGDAKAFLEAEVLPALVISISLGLRRLSIVVGLEDDVGWAAVVLGETLDERTRSMVTRSPLTAGEEWVGATSRHIGLRITSREVRAPLTRKVAVVAAIKKSSEKRRKRDWLVEVSMLPGELVDLESVTLDELAAGKYVFLDTWMLGQVDEERLAYIITRDWRQRGFKTTQRFEEEVGCGSPVYRVEVPSSGCDLSPWVLSRVRLTPEEAQRAWLQYIGRGWNNPVLV